MGTIYIGISGWRYAPWRNNFYPKGLVQKKELFFASRSVNSIEINGSFYALQTPERYAGWYRDTPEEFIFSVKAPRYVTHIKRLHDVDEAIANFLASGVLELREKLGPILWQFPPSFKLDEPLFAQFLAQLPHNVKDAIGHIRNYKPDYQPLEKIQSDRVIRHCVEIRNQSFVTDAFVELLRAHKVALVFADTAGRWPYAEDVTSDFIYMRLHGDTELYRSGYSDDALKRWSSRIRKWSIGNQPSDAVLIAKRGKIPRQLDVYCYFDNTDKLWAPKDAQKLMQLLGLDFRLRDPVDLLDAIA